MSRGLTRFAILALVMLSVGLPAFPLAAAHPYHLQIANETVSNPQPVDATHWIAQSIVPVAGAPFFVSRVSLWVRDDGMTGDSLLVSVRADSSGAPSGSDLTAGSAVGTAAASGAWLDVNMSPYVELLGGVKYWIVVHNTASAGNGYSYWDSLTDLAYGPGTGLLSSDGLSWAAPLIPKDFSFRVWGFVQPSWSFSASESTSSLAVGQPVVYRANFTNAGPGDAAALWVNVSLPAELRYTADDAASIGGVRTGTSFAFTGIVPRSYSFNMTASANGGFVNGTVASTTIFFNGTDHNGVRYPSVTRVLDLTIRAPRLALALTSSASAVAPGGSITLNATATNVGLAMASGVSLTGTVDPAATFTSSSPGTTYDSGTRTVRRTLPTLAVGASASMDWTIVIPLGTPDGTGIVTNGRAAYHDPSGAAMPNETATSTATVRVPFFFPVLLLDRSSAERGDEIAATLYFNNTGSSAASQASANWSLGGNYVLVPPLSPNVSFTSYANAFVVAWTNLAVGSHSLVARLRVARGLADGLAMPVRVLWSATDGSGNTFLPTTLVGSVALRAPAPVIALAPTSLRVVSGSILSLNLTLRNPGGAPASGWLNVSLPSGLEYVDDNGTISASVAGNRVTWTVTSLPAASVATLRVRLRASGPGGTPSVRFAFNYTDGRGSPVASISSVAAVVEISAASAPFPIGAGVGIVLLAAVVAAALLVLWRRRGGEPILDDTFVVNDGGVLLAHRSSSLIQYQDQDILIGMFKAVQDFVKDSFSRGMDEDMKGLEVGDRKILIEKGRHHFIAVVYRGGESGALRERVRAVSSEIDAKFGDTLAHWGGLMEQVHGIADLLPKVWGRTP